MSSDENFTCAAQCYMYKYVYAKSNARSRKVLHSSIKPLVKTKLLFSLGKDIVIPVLTISKLNINITRW